MHAYDERNPPMNKTAVCIDAPSSSDRDEQVCFEHVGDLDSHYVGEMSRLQ